MSLMEDISLMRNVKEPGINALGPLAPKIEVWVGQINSIWFLKHWLSLRKRLEDGFDDNNNNTCYKVMNVWVCRTVFYGEYNCIGPGADTSKRATYTKKMTYDEAKPYITLTYINASSWLLPPPNLALH